MFRKNKRDILDKSLWMLGKKTGLNSPSSPCSVIPKLVLKASYDAGVIIIIYPLQVSNHVHKLLKEVIIVFDIVHSSLYILSSVHRHGSSSCINELHT